MKISYAGRNAAEQTSGRAAPETIALVLELYREGKTQGQIALKISRSVSVVAGLISRHATAADRAERKNNGGVVRKGEPK